MLARCRRVAAVRRARGVRRRISRGVRDSWGVRGPRRVYRVRRPCMRKRRGAQACGAIGSRRGVRRRLTSDRVAFAGDTHVSGWRRALRSWIARSEGTQLRRRERLAGRTLQHRLPSGERGRRRGSARGDHGPFECRRLRRRNARTTGEQAGPRRRQRGTRHHPRVGERRPVHANRGSCHRIAGRERAGRHRGERPRRVAICVVQARIVDAAARP